MKEQNETDRRNIDGRFGLVLKNLLSSTNASRTTLRLDVPDELFPVAAEARAPGIDSIKGDSSFDLRTAPSSKFVLEHQKMLIQNDCVDSEYAPPPEFVEVYGVRAQMLGPVTAAGRLVGIISVHYVPSAREWSDEDVKALETAVNDVHELLRDEGKLD